MEKIIDETNKEEEEVQEGVTKFFQLIRIIQQGVNKFSVEERKGVKEITYIIYTGNGAIKMFLRKIDLNDIIEG